MNTKIVNRKIRPSSRKAKSSYRVSIGDKKVVDKLIVNITHENERFTGTYEFENEAIKGRKSIHFKVREEGDNISISWSPMNLSFKKLC